jgi:hypothetical protein
MNNTVVLAPPLNGAEIGSTWSFEKTRLDNTDETNYKML